MKRTSGTESILRTVLAVGAITLTAGALAGCGGRTVVVHEPAPVEQPVAEGEAETEPVVEEPVIVGEAPVEPGIEEGTVVERVVEVERRDPMVHIHVGTGGGHGHGHRHGHHPRGHGLQGIAIVHFNTGYLDGWAGADFFNRGQPLSDGQIDRMLEVGRRQGDPTGKLALAGYQEGYRAGARREDNPFAGRMTPEQSTRYHTLRGTTPGDRHDSRRDGDATSKTHVAVDSPEAEAKRKARLEASKNNLAAARANREAAQAAREAEAKRLETARLENEAARKAQLEAAREQREQRQAALKAKLEADKKQRETEREQREVALKAKIEADRKAREEKRKQDELAREQKGTARDAQAKAAKEKRDEKRDQRNAALDKRSTDRKQRLAEKKAEREAKKTQTADTAEPVE